MVCTPVRVGYSCAMRAKARAALHTTIRLHLLRGGASVFDELMLSSIQYDKFTTNTSCGFPQY